MTDQQRAYRGRIAAAFGRARAYDDAAIVQHAAARRLADHIGRADLPARPHILEIGCGTGFLTRALAETIEPAEWTISDIAPAMVARARQALAPLLGDRADYRVMDGEAIDPAIGPFDLIVSNMAFQWLADLPTAIERLATHLTPGGTIAFSTMAAGSFSEWTEVLTAEGLASGTPTYPDRDALAAVAPSGLRAEVIMSDFHIENAEARLFLRQLKAIGAATPVANYQPLPPAALRRAMARFDAGPRIVTYRIGFCLFTADRA